MRAGRAFDALLLTCALVIGCSWMVDPRAQPARCQVDEAGGKEVCPEGLQCREGICQATCRTDVPDVCGDNLDNDCDNNIDEVDSEGRDTCGDHVDNDCDGIVDEGSDGDGDGSSWCGDTVGAVGERAPRDCDDSLQSVYPGAPEICDGRDNDCDDTIDEADAAAPLCASGSLCLGQRCVAASCANEGAAAACAADERCDALSGQCVTQQCGATTCAEAELCDPVSKRCMARERRPNGAPCSEDADCDSDSCIDAAALRFAAGTRVCGQACCSDEQCSEGQRCFASGTGARSCLPTSLIPRPSPRECTTDEACKSNELCALSREHTLSPPTFIAREDVIASTCQTDLPLGQAPGARCSSYTECATFACVPSFPFGSLCSNPCGSSNDCMELAQAARRTGALGAYCRYVDVTLDDSPPDYAALCVVRRAGETGAGVYGAACSTASDCLDAGCVGATATSKGRCTSTCCSDAQCGPREDGKPISCRPFAFGAPSGSGARYEMRCDL